MASPVRRQGNHLGSDQFGQREPRSQQPERRDHDQRRRQFSSVSLAFQLRLILLGHTFVGNDRVKRKILRSEQERESWS